MPRLWLIQWSWWNNEKPKWRRLGATEKRNELRDDFTIRINPGNHTCGRSGTKLENAGRRCIVPVSLMVKIGDDTNPLT
jgi:hypothetical protein